MRSWRRDEMRRTARVQSTVQRWPLNLLQSMNRVPAGEAGIQPLENSLRARPSPRPASVSIDPGGSGRDGSRVGLGIGSNNIRTAPACL